MLYYASKLSENILRTPAVGQMGQPGERDYKPGVPGYLICKDAVIARTGWQEYKVADLNQDEAAGLGLDISNPNANVNLYRPEEEVTDPACIASFEGMPVTDSHPDDFVDRETWRRVACGHAQNVRQRAERLEDGNIALIADLFVNADPLATKVEQDRLRSLSCGYEYKLAREGDRLLQTKIRGNHIAVVENGRAGPEARINDAAAAAAASISALKPNDFDYIAPALAAPDHQGGKPTPKPRKEHHMKNVFKELIGRGLKSLAQDESVQPEELAEAATAAHKATAAEEPVAEDKRADDKRAADAEEEMNKLKAEAADSRKHADDFKKRADDADAKIAELEKQAEDRRMKDAEMAGKHFVPCGVKDCQNCKMHGMMDAFLQKHSRADDVNMQELENVLSEFLQEEAGEPEHEDAAGAGGEAGVIEPIAEGGEPEEERQTVHAAQDAAEEKAFLDRIKPVVARSKDAALIKEFNARAAKFNRRSRASNGSYAGFMTGAHAQGRDVSPAPTDETAMYAALQAKADAARGKPMPV